MASHIARRKFLATLGGAAAAWPLAASAQQPAMPVIGYLSARSPTDVGYLLAAFQRGLGELDYAEGRNVAFDYRWANNQIDQLPALAADLVRQQVSVIAAVNATASALAAKAATSTIPIVFAQGADPIALGLVASLKRPGSNVTGVTFLNNTLIPKQLEWLHELVPSPGVIALLMNPTNAAATLGMKDAYRAADVLGRKLIVVNASTENELDSAFTFLIQREVKGLLIYSDSFFDNHPKVIADLAARYALPAISPRREFAKAGGLMGYGTDVPDAFRIVGTYAGRVLKGEKPSELPVQQSTKVELVLNLKTAKALGLAFPLALLGRADEVIE